MPQIPRREIRIPVRGNILFSVGLATQGGTVKDISMHGCLVESNRPPHPASMLSCRMLLPGLAEPVEVSLALVQWVLGNHFGLKIVEISPETQKRLRQFLDENYARLARSRRGRAQEPSSSADPPSVGALGPPLEGARAFPEPEPSPATERLEEPVAILPHDLSAFVGWILDARHAFEEKTPLPPPPLLEFEEFKACTQFIQALLDESRSSLSPPAASSSPGHSHQEVMAHLLTQLKSDDSPRPLGLIQGTEGCDEDPAAERCDLPPCLEEPVERGARARRAAPRADSPQPVPLSIRLARLTAKLKPSFWFARV